MHDNLLPELQKTVHWNNCTGVRARCPDCHVPHDFTGTRWRARCRRAARCSASSSAPSTPAKVQSTASAGAARVEALRGQRLEGMPCLPRLQGHELRQDASGIAGGDAQGAERNQSCVDCHKGVAHQLPEMKGAQNPAFDTLVSSAADRAWTPARTTSWWCRRSSMPTKADETHRRGRGGHPGEGARDQGDARASSSRCGARTRATVASGTATSASTSPAPCFDKGGGAGCTSFVKVLDTREDPMTGLEWQQVTATAWMRKGSVLDSVEPVWSIARASYSSSCSVCHRQPGRSALRRQHLARPLRRHGRLHQHGRRHRPRGAQVPQTHSSDFSTSHGAGSPDSALQTARPLIRELNTMNYSRRGFRCPGHDVGQRAGRARPCFASRSALAAGEAAAVSDDITTWKISGSHFGAIRAPRWSATAWSTSAPSSSTSYRRRWSRVCSA